MTNPGRRLSLDAFINEGTSEYLAVMDSNKRITANLTTLHLLPARFTSLTLPLPSASPVRAIALTED